jgi:hypothetical protein
MHRAQQQFCLQQQQQHPIWVHQQLDLRTLRCQRARLVLHAVLGSAQAPSYGTCASHGTQQKQQQTLQQQHLPQQQALQQHLPWYNQPHAEQLRDVLKLPPFRFQTLVHQEPAILGFQSDTLALTVDALAAALHTTNRAVISILEERPAMLLTPHQPVEALHQLAHLLQRRSEEAAFLLSPYQQLLALAPQQLQRRVDSLAAVMHWPAEQQGLRRVTAAAGVSFLQLLVAPVQRTKQQLQALATALDANEAACGEYGCRNYCYHVLYLQGFSGRIDVYSLGVAQQLLCMSLSGQLQSDVCFCFASSVGHHALSKTCVPVLRPNSTTPPPACLHCCSPVGSTPAAPTADVTSSATQPAVPTSSSIRCQLQRLPAAATA